MEFEATVVKLLPAVKGTSARGEWTKQEVILEQQGEFGRKVCVSFWGDKAQDASVLREGEKISVAVNLESREFNGRWYTEVRAWRLSRATGGQQGPGPDFSEMPAGNIPPLPTSDPGDSAAESYDDLPF